MNVGPIQLPHQSGHIAYILKGFPRLSESFIAGEVRQLTSMGLHLDLYSIKQGDELASRAQLPKIHYCPTLTSMSQIGLRAWLRINYEGFKKSQKLLWRQHPIRQLKAFFFAVKSGFTYKSNASTTFKKTYIKEFLLAGYIANKILARGNVSHLHGHFCHDATTVTWMVSMLTNIPFSFTAHAKDIYQGRQNPGNFLQRKLKATSFAVTCTQANVQHLQTLCAESNKIHGIYHGLNVRTFTPPTQPRAANRLISVGRHVEKKGFLDLLQACRHLRDQQIEFVLDIIGEADDQTNHMRQAVSDLHLEDRVNLLPPMNQQELIKHYQDATLFVLPCVVVDDGDRDGIPNVMAEAMACALPVVVTGISGIPEIVQDDDNGLVVPPHDPVQLADAIRRALSSPSLRERLGTKARQKIERVFDADHTHIRLKALFDHALIDQTLTNV